MAKVSRAKSESKTVRNLVLILGDQLDRESPALAGFDPKRDRLWMAEVQEESTHVWSHQVRTALFLSAMRHFRDEMIERGFPIRYVELDDSENTQSLGSELARALQEFRPEKCLFVQPGDYRVQQSLKEVLTNAQQPFEIIEDTHFYATLPDFEKHARGRKQLRLEYYYRELRKKHN
ncbi:MAG: cryptochrome/photolyase family protein, partial [Gemmataceae bacterium]